MHPFPAICLFQAPGFRQNRHRSPALAGALEIFISGKYIPRDNGKLIVSNHLHVCPVHKNKRIQQDLYEQAFG